MTDKTSYQLHPHYRADIDGLRAIAVLSVVGFHAFPDWILGGFIGVDIFFVISGYLISSIIFSNLEHDSFSIAGFYSRRIRRIFPALITIMIVSVALGSYSLFPNAYAELGKHIAAAAAFVENFALYAESGYFDSAAETKPMLHLWSLAIEEQFYIFWPLMLAFVWKRKWSFLRITAAIGILSFAANIYLTRTNPTAAFYWPISRFWELMVGGVLAYLTLHRQHWIEPGKDIQSIFGFGLLIFGFVLITKETVFPGWWGLMPTGGAFFVISAGPQAILNRYLLSSRLMVGIGLISYPLYLWHWPLFSLAQFVAGSGFKIKIILVGLSIVLAWITYECIEKPIRSREKKISLPLFAAMILIGCFGYTSYEFGGFGSSLSEAKIGIRNITKVGDVYDYFNYKKLIREGVCHSIPFDKVIANGCIEIRERNVFIWGDSYAASLYSGLNYVRNEKHGNYGITQLTDTNGPPFFTDKLTDDGKRLTEANTNRLYFVQKYRPNVVLITWMVGGVNAIKSKEGAVIELAVTIRKIQAASPGTKIVIIGPFPSWRGTLIQQLFGYYVFHKTSPPVYMNYGLVDSTKDWDNFLSANVPRLGVTYVSSYDRFCNPTGCLTRTGNDVKDVVAVDWGHLTESGAIYLINGIQNVVFN
jgi:peptidoglycan/LPS O-acetylase OafA/YrhL